MASFILDGQIVGELEFPMYVQAAATKLPKETEDGLKKSDVIWVGTDAQRASRDDPRVVRLQEREDLHGVAAQPGPEEQTVPGVPDAQELVVVTRRKGRDTSLEEFTASQRALEGAEWEEAAKILADRRRSRLGPPGECHRALARRLRHRGARPERLWVRLRAASRPSSPETRQELGLAVRRR